MQMNQKINIKHSQSIVMTPQLRQAIKLLQFSNLELNNYIEEEIEKNPFLENNNNTNFASNNTLSTQPLKNDDEYKESSRWEENYNKRNKISSYEDLTSLEDRIEAPKKDLRTFLLDQILLDIPEGEERKIAISLLDLIEPSGWININLENFATTNNVEKDFLEIVLKKLQKLEPTGIFARNLGECLSLQLEEKGLFDKKFEIITKNLNCLARGEIKKLCRMTGIKEAELSDYIVEIKKLNPKPAEKFSDNNFRIEPPDVMINKTEKGWRIELNKSTLPALKIEESLAEKVKKQNKNEEDKKFVAEAVNSARWLMRAIEQRNSTTLKVAVEILKLQKHFFINGPGHLKPLVLKDVASSINMHESTVSRVTRAKLIQTPWGLFQMKDFFSSSVGVSEKDEAHAAKTVRTLLKDIISNEKENKPYSDEHISKIFKEKGVNVARRTVAKYREMLNIPSSAERKRLMRLNKVINIKL